MVDKIKLLGEKAISLYKKSDPSEDKLQELARESEEVLYECNTVWPFDFFPGTVRVDRKQLTITQRSFFNVSKTIKIHTKDLLNCHVETGPFFGYIDIFSRFFADDHHQVNWLRRKDSIKLHEIIQGLIIVYREEIDTTEIPKEELLEFLAKVGKR